MIAPQPPDDMVSLAELADEVDPAGSQTEALARQLWDCCEDEHAIVVMEALMYALVRLLRTAPPALQDILAHQLGEQLAAMFRAPVQ